MKWGDGEPWWHMPDFRPLDAIRSPGTDSLAVWVFKIAVILAGCILLVKQARP